MFGGKLVTSITTIHNELADFAEELIIKNYIDFGATKETAYLEIQSIRMGHLTVNGPTKPFLFH